MQPLTKVDGNFFDELELTRSVRGHLLKALLWHFAAPPKQLSASETQRTETRNGAVRPASSRTIPCWWLGFGQGLDQGLDQ